MCYPKTSVTERTAASEHRMVEMVITESSVTLLKFRCVLQHTGMSLLVIWFLNIFKKTKLLYILLSTHHAITPKGYLFLTIFRTVKGVHLGQ